MILPRGSVPGKPGQGSGPLLGEFPRPPQDCLPLGEGAPKGRMRGTFVPRPPRAGLPLEGGGERSLQIGQAHQGADNAVFVAAGGSVGTGFGRCVDLLSSSPGDRPGMMNHSFSCLWPGSNTRQTIWCSGRPGPGQAQPAGGRSRAEARKRPRILTCGYRFLAEESIFQAEIPRAAAAKELPKPNGRKASCGLAGQS